MRERTRCPKPSTPRAFVSGIDAEVDLATEMFILHPVGYDGPSRTAF